MQFFSLYGYGKDITIGKGRFEIESISPLEIEFTSEYFMSLSPFVITDNEIIADIYYEPFVRFGKFGAEWANFNAFKRPILFADSASVILFKESQNKKFIGCAVENIALSDDTKQKKSVQQGYTILLPLKDIKCKPSN